MEHPTYARERTKELYSQGYFSAETVVKVIAEMRGQPQTIPIGAATGFCRGVSGSSGMCGALAGAIMAMGSEVGRPSPDQPVEPMYDLVHQLIERFQDLHGATTCHDLLNCDFSSEEGCRRFIDAELHWLCLDFCATATQLAVELLNEREKDAPTAP